jgi:hypothetical protein
VIKQWIWAGPRPTSSVRIVQKDSMHAGVDSAALPRVVPMNSGKHYGCQKQKVSSLLRLDVLLAPLLMMFKGMSCLGG